jgi:hypothetical protein
MVPPVSSGSENREPTPPSLSAHCAVAWSRIAGTGPPPDRFPAALPDRFTSASSASRSSSVQGLAASPATAAASGA